MRKLYSLSSSLPTIAALLVVVLTMLVMLNYGPEKSRSIAPRASVEKSSPVKSSQNSLWQMVRVPNNRVDQSVKVGK